MTPSKPDWLRPAGKSSFKNNMTKEQYQVGEFMSHFGQKTPAFVTIPDRETRKLRAELILEEALETIAALGFDVEWTSIHSQKITKESTAIYPTVGGGVCDIYEVADGLADLHYVGYCGTGVAFGIDMDPVFQEVHRSNMTKMWTDKDLKKVKRLHPTGVVETFGQGLHRVKVGGKVIKSPSFSPPNIKSILGD